MSKIIWTAQRTLQFSGNWIDLRIESHVTPSGWFSQATSSHKLILTESNSIGTTMYHFAGQTVPHLLLVSQSLEEAQREYRNVQYQLGVRTIASLIEEIADDLSYALSSPVVEEREIASAMHKVLVNASRKKEDDTI